MENISGALQENILVLLCFDSKSISLVANSIDVSLFESKVYRDIASKAIVYFQQFKKPVGTHLPDELDLILHPKSIKRDAKQKAEMYKEVVERIYHTYKDGFNSEYVLSSLKRFIKIQNQKKSIMEAHDLILEGADPEEVDVALNNYRKKDIEVFDPGTFFTDHDKVLSFLDKEHINTMFMNIDILDKYRICPTTNCLFVLAGLSGRGKTWFLIHLAKTALLLRKKVVHISLEMSEDDLKERYCQTLFSVSNRDEEFDIPVFKRDDLGRFMDVDFEKLKANHHFKHSNIRSRLLKELKKLRKPHLIIKDFPTGFLTLDGLTAYLDGLINYHNFIPDLILLDYPDIMKIKGKDKTDEVDRLFINLRGLASKKEYNCAIAVVSQINREGKRAGAAWFDEGFLTGAYSRFFHADVFLTYNQSDFERDMNMARLLVVKGRNDRTGLRVAISQSYDTGQFCLDSVPLVGKTYFNVIKELKKEED